MSTENTQPRWKSRVMWAAIAAQIAAIVGILGGWDYIGVTSDTFQGVATGVLEILTLFGVINNPTNSASL